MATSAQIAKWKAQPLPYCLTRFDREAMRSRPYGSKRYATIQEALKAASRIHRTFLFVDYAGAFDRVPA